jgi:hypothetical protein
MHYKLHLTSVIILMSKDDEKDRYFVDNTWTE